MAVLGIIVIAATALGFTWHTAAQRSRQHKAREVLHWIQSSLAGRGHVVGISWITSSRFRVPLRLTCGVFQRAWVMVELHAHQNPVQWIFNKLKGTREVLTFQADLDFPPTFSLQVQNFRWFARSSRKASIERPGWRFEQLPPIMISTRPQRQQQEIASTMTSLSKGDNGEFLEINFQRHSPHFSATLPLEALAPEAPSRTYILDAMRELAGNATFF
jgi:type II secretory pathway pseudopilin PulG